MTPIPRWLSDGPAWMIEQWHAMPTASTEDALAVVQSTRALLEAVRANIRFSWILEMSDAA